MDQPRGLCQPSGILEHADVLHLVVLKLRRGDVVRLSGTCRFAYRFIGQLQARGLPWCKPRVLLTCSNTAALVELDDRTSRVVSHTCKRCRSALPPQHVIVGRSKMDTLVTGVAISPYDHDIYVSDYQVKGVRQFCERTLEQKRLFRGPGLCSPEGLAFLRRSLFVASAGTCCVVRFDLARGALTEALDLGWEVVPWGIAAEPRPQGSPTKPPKHVRSLFVAVDFPSRAPDPDSSNQSQTKTGRIVRVTFDRKGRMLFAGKFSNSAILRPSGICFTPCGDLLVTTMDKEVLRLAGPRHALPGSTLQVVHTGAWLRDAVPWDVLHVAGALFITLHTGQRGKWTGAGIAIATLSGQLVSIIQHPLLVRPNMLAVDP